MADSLHKVIKSFYDSLQDITSWEEFKADQLNISSIVSPAFYVFVDRILPSDFNRNRRRLKANIIIILITDTSIDRELQVVNDNSYLLEEVIQRIDTDERIRRDIDTAGKPNEQRIVKLEGVQFSYLRSEIQRIARLTYSVEYFINYEPPVAGKNVIVR